MYPGRELSSVDQRRCRRHARAAGTVLAIRRIKEFRQSYAEAGTSDPALVRETYQSCQVVHEWRCHSVADGRFYKCPQSYFLPKLVAGCAANQAVDSILIEDPATFGRDLLAYLESTQPLAACGHCLGTSGWQFPHGQVRRVEFRGLQQGTAEELVDPGLLMPLPTRR